MSTNKILDGLNENQIKAITTTEGYVRIIAGAGSGKTKALTNRFAYLVEELGVMPSNVLCVTFTNKAAAEMKKRIRKMIGDLDLGKISTFHGFCVQFLKEDCNAVQYPSKFIILDEEDIDLILKECFTKLEITSREYTFKQAINDLSILKSNLDYIKFLIDPSMELLNKSREQAETIKEKVLFEFLYIQRKTFGVDFNDLINFTLHILQTDEDVRLKWQKRLQYIMVDEFQDVSSNQYALVSILSDYHKNLFIVGDPDQTIYSWRGANINFILDFDKDYPSAKTISMNENYRSLPEIINVSNTLIKKNKNRIDKELTPIRTEKGNCVYFHAKTSNEEAIWIANQLISLKEQGVDFSKSAILYRAHFISRTIEEILVKNQIPYILYSGTAFYRRKEIKDILCYFRIIANEDDIAFIRIINEPKRGVGKKRIDFIKNYAERNNCTYYKALKDNVDELIFSKTKVKAFVNLIDDLRLKYRQLTLTDLLNEILNKTNYEELLRKSGEDERLDNIAELKQSIFDYEISAGEEVLLEDYLEYISLFTNIDKNEKVSSVKMMTIHTAKGLEFPNVFVCGLSEGVFPTSKTDTIEKLEEERRLAYVAFTRAENKLFLSDSEGVNNDGSFRYPSRFIFNCERVNLNYEVELSEYLLESARNEINFSEKQLIDVIFFKINDYISHSIFGNGIIVDIDKKQSCYIIKFDEMDTNRNLSFKSRLKKTDKVI